MKCKECGFQESEHGAYDAYDGCCQAYMSPDRRREAALLAAERARRKAAPAA